MLNSPLFRALNVQDRSDLRSIAKELNISVKKLDYYAEKDIFPFEEDLKRICDYLNIDKLELQLKLGYIDSKLKDLLKSKSKEVRLLINDVKDESEAKNNTNLTFTTDYGEMYQGDCIQLMKTMDSGSVDLIFADPPFNLDKQYESGYNDKLSDSEYLKWTEEWLLECVRILKEGGSMFVWNLPKWNTSISSILNNHLEFRHWIAVDIKYRLPIKNRLYPSHYGLLYYIKGERPSAFNERRNPLKVCRHCTGDIHDYGGYKGKLNPKGINLTDVWDDIPPVRHSKYKTRGSNELSLKLLERIISIASNEGDTVFDPFGGSGTTYVASEILKRKWIGVEIGSTDVIKQRFDDIEWQQKYINNIHNNVDVLFTEEMKEKRLKNGHWIPENLSRPKAKAKQKVVQQSLKL